MSEGRPLPFRWTGEGFEPLPGFAKVADRQFVVGERYILAAIEDRSNASHRHEFAWLREAWLNLPEKIAEQYASAEHLRKAALIEAGFYHESVIDAGTNAAALRVAAFIKAMDEFSVVIVRGPVVVRRWAKSQSYRSMPKDEFQRSKTAIMEVIADMIGVTPDQLRKAEAA